MNGELERVEVYGLMGTYWPIVGAFPFRVRVRKIENERQAEVTGWYSTVVIPFGCHYTNPPWDGPKLVEDK